MPKSTEIMEDQDDYIEDVVIPQSSWWRHHGGLLLALPILLVMLVVGFNLAYAGKVFPGVSVAGVYLGGLSPKEAETAVNKRIKEFEAELIPVSQGQTTLRLSPAKLGYEYDVAASV